MNMNTARAIPAPQEWINRVWNLGLFCLDSRYLTVNFTPNTHLGNGHSESLIRSAIDTILMQIGKKPKK